MTLSKVHCVVCKVQSPAIYAVGCQSIGKHSVCSNCVNRIVEQHIDFHELG